MLPLLLAGAVGGGVTDSGVTDSSASRPELKFALPNSGHYRVDGLPSLPSANVKHMPVWRDNVRLGVGVDQGAEHLRDLPITGQWKGFKVRTGPLNDGVGDTTLQTFMNETMAGFTRFATPVPPVTVSWDASASAADRQRITRAVQLLNAALPEHQKMGIAVNGSIPIRFLDSEQYRRRFGDSWGRALYGGGIVINRDYSTVDDRRAIILLTHEIMHTLEFSHPDDARFDTIIESGRSPTGSGWMYQERQGIPQPLTLLYPIDREALRRLYSQSSLGPWESASLHIAGHGQQAAFGVALRNGYAEPWAYGHVPSMNLADNPALTGTATWSGALLGLTPEAAAVAGDAAIGVNLGTMTGSADFTELESWAAQSAPGEAGSGTQWLDGDLGYTIAVRGNTFRETGGDDGVLTGIFVGRSHEGAAGTLERSDLTAAFGATR